MSNGKLIRSLVVGFPIGLLLLGTGSMILTQVKKANQPLDADDEKRLVASSLQKRAVDVSFVQASMKTLAETIGERHLGKPETLEQAAFWLESTLGPGNLGYKVERHVYEVEETEVRNLIAELPGTNRRREIVVVGAHYDTVPDCPGANDNGSGVAALLTIARAMAGEQQERTVRFVAFVNEEPPYFQTEQMGSSVYARRCRGRDENIVAMLALDTIGYYSENGGSQEVPPGLDGDFPDTGNFLAFVGNEASRYQAEAARVAFAEISGIPALGGAFPADVPGVGWSDHWSFWQEGYPGVMVTDTAPYRYPHYHKSTDTIDKIDVEKLTLAIKGLEAVVRAWSNPDAAE
ncbi:MAG: M28 family peptidase [Verrucomicrobiota bacterium]